MSSTCGNNVVWRIFSAARQQRSLHVGTTAALQPHLVLPPATKQERAAIGRAICSLLRGTAPHAAQLLQESVSAVNAVTPGWRVHLGNIALIFCQEDDLVSCKQRAGRVAEAE